MTSFNFTPIPGAERLVALHAAELPQKDELCGAFWATLALRHAGVVLDGGPLDQDAVARVAGSLLSRNDHGDGLPYGHPGRTDYRLALPTIESSDESGTSAAGVNRALHALGGERVAAVPVAGPWTPAAVRAVLDSAEGCREPCTVIANVATGHFWGSHSEPAGALEYLISGNADAGAPSEWDVGHFVGILGRITGPKGTLIVVADTYETLGWRSIHLQPIERMAHALARTGSDKPSGMIVVCRPSDGPGVESAIRAAGLELGLWDNGTPDPEGAV